MWNVSSANVPFGVWNTYSPAAFTVAAYVSIGT